MKLYTLDSVLTFGQHKGQTIAEVLENNPTYPEWCYANMDDFYVTDEVWNAMDVHRNLEDALKNGGVDANAIRKAKINNEKLHQAKRNKYKTLMMERFESDLDKQLKGRSDLPF
jgi:hypothetical protein